MDTVHVDWPKGAVLFDQIKTFQHSEWDLDKNGFYAIYCASYDEESRSWKNLVLLYIGQAFEQTLRQRIPQPHDAYDCVFDYQKKHPGTDVIVKIGYITKSTVQKVTQQLFDDVECCLTFCNKPYCSITCKDSYSGRDLQVINTGDPPLKDQGSCSEKELVTV